MKLLLDENLSFRALTGLQALYPGSIHAVRSGLGCDPDWKVWSYAASEGFIIVTQDKDFESLSRLRGAPPKVILLRHGNLSPDETVKILNVYHETIRVFSANPNKAYLEIY